MAAHSPRRSGPSIRLRRFPLELEAAERRVLLASALHHPLVIATLGDSLTDEYTFYRSPVVSASDSTAAGQPLSSSDSVGLSSARNWVSNLAATRSTEVTFGASGAISRGEPRDQGFAEDWARLGATAGGLVQQETGLLTQTPANSGDRPRDVAVVTIAIGTNDYSHSLNTYIASNARDDKFAPIGKNRISPVNTKVEGAIRTAVARIRHTIPLAKIVVATPLDLTATPYYEPIIQGEAFTHPTIAGEMARSLQALNADLNQYAHAQGGVGLVNIQVLFHQRLAAAVIGGLPLDHQASGQDLNDAAVDGLHPGTLLQGVLAQAIVRQVDTLFGRTVITPLTDADIVSYALATQSGVTLTRPAGSPTDLIHDPRRHGYCRPGQHHRADRRCHFRIDHSRHDLDPGAPRRHPRRGPGR